ncbi:MAG: AMP-binding protein [Promethearchaeota archaeon]
MQESEILREPSGFVKLIWQQLIPLNYNPSFKERYKNNNLTFMINIKDTDSAALIRVRNGELTVENVKNGDKKYMKNLYTQFNCDGMLETTTATLIEISQGNMSQGAMLKEIIKRKIRVKGIKKLKLLNELFNFNLISRNITSKTLLRDIIKKWAEIYGDKTFLTYIVDFDKGLDEKYSYKEMHSYSNRLANGFLEIGIGKGDGIALMDINSPEYLFTIFAAMKIGAYIVLVNTGLKGESLRYIIDHSDASSIVIHWSFLNSLLEIKDDLPKLEKIIVDLREAPPDFKIPDGFETLEKLMDAPDKNINIEIAPDDLCMLMYTAGTTGLPKAIMFWQGKLLGGLNIKTLIKLVSLLALPDDVIFTPLPLFHSNALFLSTFAAYLSGLPLVLGKKFSASRHWDICRKYKITTFNTLGAMVTFLMKQPERPNDREHNVRVVNTAACPRELWEAFEKRFGVTVREAYGATDGGGYMLLTHIYDNVPVGTMGKPLPGITAEVMDDKGKILTEPEQIGELVFLVKDNEVKDREVKYFKDEQASKSLIRESADGRKWFHTGDLAYKDADGWFYFVDRKKDSIRRRGENIASYSIEKVILQNEKVLECAAYGVKSEYGEDEIMISVVLKPGEKMEPKEIVDFCRGKMADFMIPRYVDIVEELPKNEVHRVLKRELKKRGITETTYDAEKENK